MFGPYAWSYWMLIFCNGVVPQTLWIKSLRTNTVWLFIMSLIVNVGMWLERFVIIVTSLHRDFLPSSWGMYYPTFWDFSTFFGTIGLFFDADVPVHPVAADDLDLRDADAAAGGEGERRGGPLSHAPRASRTHAVRPDGRVRRPERPDRGGAADVRRGLSQDRRLLAVPDRAGLAKRSASTIARCRSSSSAAASSA